jgi:hypothetical protein
VAELWCVRIVSTRMLWLWSVPIELPSFAMMVAPTTPTLLMTDRYS